MPTAFAMKQICEARIGENKKRGRTKPIHNKTVPRLLEENR